MAFTTVLLALAVVRPLFLALALAQGLLALAGGAFVALCLGAPALFPDRGLALLLAIGRFALSCLRLPRIVVRSLRLPCGALFLAARLLSCAILRLRTVGSMVARAFLRGGGECGRDTMAMASAISTGWRTKSMFMAVVSRCLPTPRLAAQL